MTSSEKNELAEFKDEVRRDIKALRTEIRPALEFYTQIAAIGRFVKWGMGVGASVVTIIGGLRMFGIV